MYEYSWLQWLLVFYIYCFLGWCFESTIVSVQQRRFVNRGFLRGPMLPIYGFGATMLLHISLPLYAHPFLLFIWSMAAATVFEYLVGWAMETLFKVKYWDYSEHKFQFQGRICLQSSLCWGVMGLILARFIHPPVEGLVIHMPFFVTVIGVVLLSAMFASDVAVSVRTALDLARVLEELDKLREQADELRAQLSETALVGLTKLSYRVDEARGEWSEKMDDAKEQFTDAVGDAKEQIQQKLDELQRRFEERAGGLKRTRKSLLRGNPAARSTKYDEVLQRLKKQVDHRKHG